VTDPVAGRNAGSGLFLVLEGGEGVGKTTQARLLARWLKEAGVPHTLSREPGGTPVGEAIRRVLLEERELEMPAETELLLMLAARAAFVREVVRPALERGEVVVADRFEYSTFVYQGVARGIGIERTRELNAFAAGGTAPDLVLVLDVPADEGRDRQRRVGKEADRIEGEGTEFLERVHRAYRALAAADPNAELVPAAADVEEVHGAVLRILAHRFPEPFGPAEG
jgi:dTMP kinase